MARLCRLCGCDVYRAPLQGGNRTVLSSLWLHVMPSGMEDGGHRGVPLDEGVLWTDREREGLT